MNYPVWQAGDSFSGWIYVLIHAVFTVSTLSVFGAGLYLALAESRKIYSLSPEYRNFVKRATGAVLFTVTVPGSLAFVSLWVIYILTAPGTTAVLANQLSWMWIIQALALALESATAFVLYKSAGKSDNAGHTDLAWSFAALGFLTLIVTNAALSFQQTPGIWVDTQKAADAWFNASYLASLFLRSLVSIQMGGVLGFVGLSLVEKSSAKDDAASWTASFVMYPFFFLPLGLIWYYFTLDEKAVANIWTGFSGVNTSDFSILSRLVFLSVLGAVSIFFFAFVGGALNATGFKKPMAFWFIVLVLLTSGVTEYTRSLLNQPYSISGFAFNNGIKISDAEELNSGFLAKTRWSVVKEVTEENILVAGKELHDLQFTGNPVSAGFVSLETFLKEAKTVQDYLDFISIIRWGSENNIYTQNLPPFVGSDAEANALATYLAWKAGQYEPTPEQTGFYSKYSANPASVVQ